MCPAPGGPVLASPFIHDITSICPGLRNFSGGGIAEDQNLTVPGKPGQLITLVLVPQEMFLTQVSKNRTNSTFNLLEKSVSPKDYFILL
jgi:hypothetical protein